MVDGIGTILSKVGYRVILANTQNNEKEELKYLQALKKSSGRDYLDGNHIFEGSLKAYEGSGGSCFYD
jgi:hypothetical protein